MSLVTWEQHQNSLTFFKHNGKILQFDTYYVIYKHKLIVKQQYTRTKTFHQLKLEKVGDTAQIQYNYDSVYG